MLIWSLWDLICLKWGWTVNNNMSYAEMFQAAMNEAKREIDRYFKQKIKEYENPPRPFYEDRYP